MSTSTLAIYDVRSAYVQSYGWVTGTVLATSLADALRIVEAQEWLLERAAEVTVTRGARAYCEHNDGHRNDGEAVWRCDDCKETFPDTDVAWDATASSTAFKMYCDRVISNGRW